MAEFPALPLFVADWIADTWHLDRITRCLYHDLLCVMWISPHCRVPNDIGWITERLRCTKEEIPILERIKKDFLSTDGNWLFQKRLKREFKYVTEKRQKATDAVKSRWQKEKDPYGRNTRRSNTPHLTSPHLIEEEKELTTLVPKRTNGTRLPEDWRPSPELWAWAKSQDFTDPELEIITAEFVDYWIAVPGAKGTKLNWNSTFKNRIRFKLERKGDDHGRRQTRTFAAELAKVDAVIDELERRENAQRANGNGTNAGDIPGLWQGSGTVSDHRH